MGERKLFAERFLSISVHRKVQFKIWKILTVTLVCLDIMLRVIISRGFGLTTSLPGRTITTGVAFCDMRNAMNRLDGLP